MSSASQHRACRPIGRLAAIAATFLLSLVFGCASKTPPEPIWIGHVTALHEASQGVVLAIEEMNEQPSKGRLIAVRHVEEAGKGIEPGPAAVRLLTINHVSALIGSADPESSASLASIAQSYTVPLAAPSDLAKASLNPFVFPLGLSAGLKGRSLARFAARELKVGRVAVLVRETANQPGADGLLRAELVREFTRECRAQGSRVTGELTYRDPAELRDRLQRAAADQPDSVLLGGNGDDLVQLRKAAGFAKLPVMLGAAGDGARGLAPGRDDGPTYIATAFAADGPGPDVEKFDKKYQARFGEPPDAASALGYDCARFLGEGIRKTDVVEGPKIQEALAALESFESVTGPITREKDGMYARPVFVVRIAYGQVSCARRLDAQADGSR